MKRFAAFVAAAFFWGTNLAHADDSAEISQVALDYVSALSQGDADKILSMVLVPDETTENMRGFLQILAKKNAEKAKEKGGFLKARIQTLRLMGNSAEADVLRIFGYGATDIKPVYLQKEKGQWRWVPTADDWAQMD